MSDEDRGNQVQEMSHKLLNLFAGEQGGLCLDAMVGAAAVIFCQSYADKDKARQDALRFGDLLEAAVANSFDGYNEGHAAPGQFIHPAGNA